MSRLPFVLVCCVLVFLSLADVAVSSTCGSLPPKSVCQGILPSDQKVTVGTTSESSLFVLSALWSQLTPSCRNAVAVVACQKAYPPCNVSTPLSCQASCDLITTTCTSDEQSWVNAVQSLTCAPSSCQPAPSNLASTASPAYPKCEAYTGTLCKDTLAAASRTTVYVKAGSTQTDIEEEYVQLKKLLPLAPRDTSCVYRALDF